MVSMRNADGESAGFFLLAAQVEQSSTYFYYVKTGDGAFQQRTTKADEGDTFIYEEDRKDGEVVTFGRAFANPRMSLWGVIDPEDKKWEFHIPRGSIQKQFSIK
jgi:hypothetical protein